MNRISPGRSTAFRKLNPIDKKGRGCYVFLLVNIGEQDLNICVLIDLLNFEQPFFYKMNLFLVKEINLNFVKKVKYLLSKSIIMSDHNLPEIDKNLILFCN